MKALGIFTALGIFSTATMSCASDLIVIHTDIDWKDGNGKVPKKGICLKYGGESLSPPMQISGIPVGAETIRLLFTDDKYGREGGHEDFTVKLNGQSSIELPPFGGDTNYLPANIIGGNGNHCYSCKETDYLGPCSGGRNHTYRVIVHAKNAKHRTFPLEN